MSRPVLTALFALLATLAGPRPAAAQRGIDAHLFHPAVDSYGGFAVERAQTARQLTVGLKLTFDGTLNPFALEMIDPTTTKPRRQTLIDRQFVVHLGVDFGITDWLELVLDVPASAQSFTSAYGSYGPATDVTLTRSGFYAADPYTNIPPPDGGPLDTRVGLKARLKRQGPFGFALLAMASLPFGDDAAFLGDGGATFRANAIADFEHRGLALSLNVGAIVRQTTTVYDPSEVAGGVAKPRVLLSLGHELTWALGLSYRFVPWVGIAAEIYGYTPLNVGAGRVDHTADVLGGLQFFPVRQFALVVAAGAGIIPGAMRHDDFRGILSAQWTSRGDVARGRGADLDSDHDGIPDAVDQCPQEPEDKDGFEDDDGCPDPDNDHDGIPDALDRCPNAAEDRDGFEDDDGCPDIDNDQDGIPDQVDRCPNEAEDRDGFEDDDGCPDLDNDGDGIPDAKDKCPNEPETRNGIDDQDGCPDSGTVTTVDLSFVLNFDSGSAALTPASTAILAKVADRLSANAWVRRIRIEGHSDDLEGHRRGPELSQLRADAVRAELIRRGIDQARLQSVGYQATRPLEADKTVKARATNRRVTFVAVEQ